MNFPADPFLSDALEKRKEQNAFRQLITNSNLIDFCSNDYLGFAQSSELLSLIKNEFESISSKRSGSGGSRLLSGNTEYAESLEKKIAAFHNAQSGLIYNSGYDANVGLFSALGHKNASIIYDELIHASVHDGIKMSSASSYMFRHNDLFHLEERLKIAEGVVYVAVESIYSMDGDEALLKEISVLCKKYKASLIVDEAHATGVTENCGRGLVQKLSMEEDVFARVHTFGKALGCHGAIVTGSSLLRDYLINFSRSFIYTTALPLHSLIAINQSYLLLERSEKEIKKLHYLIEAFRSQAKEYPLIQLIESRGPVQCIIINENSRVKAIAASLRESGFDVRPILSPTVQRGKERLRICIHTFNTEEQTGKLLSQISKKIQLSVDN